MAAAIIAHLVALTIVVVVPLVGYRRYCELMKPETSEQRRHELLLRSVVFKWGLIPPVLFVWSQAPDPIVLWGKPEQWYVTAVLLLSVAAGAVVVRVRLRSPEQRRKLAAVVAKFAALIPRNTRERRFFVVVAITAGVTEEIAYRAFLIAYLVWLMPGLDWYTAVIVAGVLFGLVHAYQGVKGVVPTGAIGILFGYLYLDVGLIVLMVAHAAIDLRTLLLPAALSDAGPTDKTRRP